MKLSINVIYNGQQEITWRSWLEIRTLLRHSFDYIPYSLVRATHTHTLARSWTHTLFQIKHKYIQIDKLWLERLSNMGLIQFYNKQCSYTLRIESFDAPNVWKLLDPNLIYMYHNKWIKERMSIDTLLVNCNLWCSYLFAFHFWSVPYSISKMI